MKPAIDESTSISELGAIVCDALQKKGMDAFLSGGAVVSIYTKNMYQSYDLDFVTLAERRKIHVVMVQLGFDRTESRLYAHPKTKFAVEFPGAAFLIGDEPIRDFAELKLPQGTLKLLTPTDCVKDRLAAFFHWNDRQGLNQAVAVATAHPVNIADIEAWSTREGRHGKFNDFLEAWKKSGLSAKTKDGEEAEGKVHPWRLCPAGEHAVRTHPLRVPPGKAHPEGSVVPRHFHCAKNPSGNDELNSLEIQAIAKAHFSRLKGGPCQLSLDFKNGDQFDELIRGWVRYWNEVLDPGEPLDANLIKALIASESSFNPNAGKSRKTRNAARGLIQLNSQAVKALGNEKGELKDHYVTISGNDRYDPNLSICAGIRWLFQKQVLASHRLGRQASWEESVEEYKSILKDRLAGKKLNPNLMGKFSGYFERLKKCQK